MYVYINRNQKNEVIDIIPKTKVKKKALKKQQENGSIGKHESPPFNHIKIAAEL